MLAWHGTGVQCVRTSQPPEHPHLSTETLEPQPRTVVPHILDSAPVSNFFYSAKNLECRLRPTVSRNCPSTETTLRYVFQPTWPS